MDRQISDVYNICRDLNSERGPDRRVRDLMYFLYIPFEKTACTVGKPIFGM